MMRFLALVGVCLALVMINARFPEWGMACACAVIGAVWPKRAA